MNEVLRQSDSNPASAGSGDFRRQCFLICVVAALMALASRWPAALLLVAACGIVFADAWTAGIGRRADGRGLNKVSPLLWGIFAGLSPVVVLPIYLFNRKRLISGKGSKVLWALTMFVGAIVLLLLPFMAVSLLVGPFD